MIRLLVVLAALLVKAWACPCGPERDIRTHRYSWKNTLILRLPRYRIDCDRCGETTGWMDNR